MAHLDRDSHEPVVLYQVKTVIRNRGTKEVLQTIIVLRRYSEFVKVRLELCSAFFGGHLYPSIPHVPPKQLKVLADHLDPVFIENRRHALQVFLRKLVGLPRANTNPDVRIFLGLVPDYVVALQQQAHSNLTQNPSQEEEDRFI